MQLLFFISPLALFLAVPFYVLYFSGESFASLKKASFNKGLVGYAYNDSNYQAIKWFRLTEDDKFDIIALGSSRVLLFEEHMFKERFYNAGYSVKKLKDILGFMETIPKDKLPDHLLLGLDQWMFNTNWNTQGTIRKAAYWEEQFKQKPSFSEIKSVYKDLWSLKYSLRDIWSVETKLGLNANINERGIRTDGSMNYGLALGDDYQDFSRTLRYIDKGVSRFKYGEDFDENMIDDLKILLEFCKAQKIHVTAILPPFPELVSMRLHGGKHEYVFKLFDGIAPLFEKFAFDLFDFTSMAHLGVKDLEFMDGFHGRKTVYQRIIYEIRKSNVEISELINE